MVAKATGSGDRREIILFIINVYFKTGSTYRQPDTDIKYVNSIDAKDKGKAHMQQTAIHTPPIPGSNIYDAAAQKFPESTDRRLKMCAEGRLEDKDRRP